MTTRKVPTEVDVEITEMVERPLYQEVESDSDDSDDDEVMSFENQSIDSDQQYFVAPDIVVDNVVDESGNTLEGPTTELVPQTRMVKQLNYVEETQMMPGSISQYWLFWQNNEHYRILLLANGEVRWQQLPYVPPPPPGSYPDAMMNSTWNPTIIRQSTVSRRSVMPMGTPMIRQSIINSQSFVPPTALPQISSFQRPSSAGHFVSRQSMSAPMVQYAQATTSTIYQAPQLNPPTAQAVQAFASPYVRPSASIPTATPQYVAASANTSYRMSSVPGGVPQYMPPSISTSFGMSSASGYPQCVNPSSATGYQLSSASAFPQSYGSMGGSNSYVP